MVYEDDAWNGLKEFRVGKLSVIIPVYNVEKYITSCLDSINISINYFLTNNSLFIDSVDEYMEVIIVDDGSTDSSGHIVNQYVEKYDYLKVLHQSNAGVAAARNAGIRLAAGDYLWFVDSDDEITKESIDIIIKNINKSLKTDVFLYDAAAINNKKVDRWAHFDEGWEINDKISNLTLSAGTLYFPILDEGNNDKLRNTNIPLAAPWDKIIRRDLLVENNIFFNEALKVLDDMVFSMSVFSCSDKTIYNKEEIYLYRYVEDSITHKYTKDRVSKDMSVWSALWEEYARIFSVQEMTVASELSELFMQAIFLRIIKSFSISCGLSIFNRNNPLNIRHKLKYAKTVTDTYYYKEAFSKVKLKYAEWRLKPVIIMVRLRCLFGVYVLSKLNELI